MIMRMKALCLLACLCLPSLILSEFKEMSVDCNHQEAIRCNETDSCTWNTTLDRCLTLQIHCTQRIDERTSRTLCSSPEECGLERTSKFFDKLLGNISCNHKVDNRQTTCKLLVSCNQTVYLCQNENCDLHYIFNRNNGTECTFHHDITQCIKTRGKFQDINCTMEPLEPSQSLGHRSTNCGERCEGCPPMVPNGTTKSTTTGPHTDAYGISTIVLGCLSNLWFLVFLIYKCWKCRQKRRLQANQAQPGNVADPAEGVMLQEVEE